jgi:hypothetical protein
MNPEHRRGCDQRVCGNFGGFGGSFDLNLQLRPIFELLAYQRSCAL